MKRLFPSKVAAFFASRRARPPPHAPKPPGGFADMQAARLGPPPPATPDTRTTHADIQLLAWLLRLATGADQPVPLATAVIARFGSFAAVLAAPPRDLFAVQGFGIHSVAALKLVHEAALRLLKQNATQLPVLEAWPDVLAYLTSVLARERVEQFRILFLDRTGALLADEAQARGTVNHTPVYPREVASRALQLGAAGLILVHNHPSGDPTPSVPDIDMTEQVAGAVSLFGITVLDHVIIGNGRCTSFRQEGLLGPAPD